MIQKKPLIENRIRKIYGSFAWISHQFLRQGFWNNLTHHELLLYLFLVMVGDRNGLSYYSFDKICSLLAINTDEYICARNALIDKDLIAFDGHLFQVLSLPERVISEPCLPIKSRTEMVRRDPATIHQLLTQQFAPSSSREFDHE
jgi:hypothetical protein